MDWPWALEGQLQRRSPSGTALKEPVIIEEKQEKGEAPAFTGKDSLFIMLLAVGVFVALSVWVLGIGFSFFTRLFF